MLNSEIAPGFLWIPSQPDKSARDRVLDAIVANNDDAQDQDMHHLQKQWPVTCQVKIDMRQSDGWILWSLDAEGNTKTQGGDEFYIAITACDCDDDDDDDPKEPSATTEQIATTITRPYAAVAVIHDRGDGSYRLDFSATPTSPQPPNNNIHPQRGGAAYSLDVYFQYSCGIGKMAPPSKASWKNGGYTHKRYDTRINQLPPIRPFFHPNISVDHNSYSQRRIMDWSQFDLIVAFGDSTMEQFVRQRPNKKGKYFFQSNITQGVKVTTGLNSSTLSTLLETLEQGKGDLLRDSSGRYPQKAVMVGSCLWDVLDSKDTVQGTEYLDHQQACRDYIKQIRERYPDVTILWRSPIAVHIHVVDLERLVVSKMGEAALFGIERIRYMSASRSRALYDMQKRIVGQMQEELGNLVFVDLYEASYLSADWLFPSDGRHYRPDWNRLMLQGFYPSFTPSTSNDDDSGVLVVSSDGNGGNLLDIPKPYFIDPTFDSTVAT